MKKIRKSVCLIIAFVFCALAVSGCALFERDIEYYNNMVVARVGQNIKITKKELITAYNNFGYQYVQNNGYSKKKALEETLDLLIDREIVIELSIQNFSDFKGVTAENREKHINSLRGKSGMDGLFYQALNDDEKAEARKSAFESMNSNLKVIEKKVREERKQSDPSAEDTAGDDSASESENVFNKYEAYIQRSAGNTVFSIDVSKYASQKVYFITDTDPASSTFGEKICTVPMKWTPKVRAEGTGDAREKAVADETYARFVRDLRNSEKGLTFKKDKDSDVVEREVGRLIEGYSKNILYERLKACFEQGISKPIDRTSDEFAELAERLGGTEQAYMESLPDQSAWVNQLVNQAVDYYKAQVKTQINRYKKGLETDESLGSKVMEGLADVYWLPESIINNYFTVSHILIGYSEEQTALIAKKKEEVKAGKLSAAAFQNWLDTLDVTGIERDENGKETGNKQSAAAVLAELNGRLNTLSESNAAQRISTFREYIYKYNTDPGMFNPEFEYVMGVNDSKMVEQFTDASRELYGYEKKYKVVNGETTKEFEWKKTSTPIKSAMSGIVMTEYGAHIIMYTRPLSDFIYTSTVETDYYGYQKYLFAPLTSYGDSFGGQVAAKTYFDSIVDKLNKPAYEKYEKSIISTFKQKKAGSGQNAKTVNKVTVYKGNYKDLI